MNAQQLKRSILKFAMEGKLVNQKNDEKVNMEYLPTNTSAITLEEKKVEIPSNWIWVRLGDLIKVSSGKNLTKKQMNDEGTYPVYGGNGICGFHTTFNVEANTLLIGRVGYYCGSTHLTQDKSWVTDNALIVRYDEKIIFVEWLKKALTFIKLGETSQATAQPVISGKKIYSLVLAIPPLEEQKRIVDKIRILEEKINQYDKLYNRNDDILKKFPLDLKKSIIQYAMQGKLVRQDINDEPVMDLVERIKHEKEELVRKKIIKKEKDLPRITDEEIPFEIPESWEWIRLGDLNHIIMGQSPPGESVSAVSSGMEFHQGKTNFSKRVIDKSTVYTSAPSKIAPANSLLMSVRAPVGDINVTDRDICIGRGLCSIKPLSSVSLDYMYYMLSMFKPVFERQGTGSTFKAITGSVVKNQIFPLPPLKEQERIVSAIEVYLQIVEKLTK